MAGRWMGLALCAALVWGCDDGAGGRAQDGGAGGAGAQGGQGGAGGAGGQGGGSDLPACAVQLPVAEAVGAAPIDVEGLMDLALAEDQVPGLAVLGGPVGEQAWTGAWFPQTGSLRFHAPTSPATMDATVTYTMALIVGDTACSLGALTVTPLPPAGPRTLDSVLGDLRTLSDLTWATVGLDRAAYADADEATREALAPLVAADALLDPAVAGGLVAMLAGEVDGIALAAADRAFLDRVIATVPVAADPLPLMTSIADCGVTPFNLTTDAQLDCWMKAQANAAGIFGSTAARTVRATIGVVIGVAGAVSGGAGWAVGGAVNFVANLIIDLFDALLPSTLTDLQVELQRELCPADEPTWSEPQLAATNKGYAISVFTIADALTAAIGLGKIPGPSLADDAGKALRITSEAAEQIERFSEIAFQALRDVLINYTGIVLPDVGGSSAPFGKRTWIVTLTDRFYTVAANGPVSANPATRTYRALLGQTGNGDLTFTTADDAFGDQQFEAVEPVAVDEARLVVDPVVARSGDVVTLSAERICLPDDAVLVWGSLGTDGGQILDRDRGTYRAPSPDDGVQTYPSEVFVGVVSPAEVAGVEGRGDVAVIDTCCVESPPASCTAEERCACPEPPDSCEGTWSLEPIAGCVAPGATFDFDLLVLGGVTTPVRWRAEAADGGAAGAIDADGVWTAPGREADVTITVEELDGEQSARQRVTVAADCEGWRAVVTGRGPISGERVYVTPSGVEDEDGVLQWVIALSTEANTAAASIAIAAHPGLRMACDGPTGRYRGVVAVTTNTWAFTAEAADIQVVALGPAMVRVAFSGNGLLFDMASPEEGTPALVTGGGWRANACGGDPDPDPLADAVPLGALQPDGEVCLEGFAAEGFPAARFERICAADPTCMAGGRCPAANRLGRCDLRGQGNVLGFPQVQHYYAGFEGADVAELREVCDFQNGVWVPN